MESHRINIHRIMGYLNKKTRERIAVVTPNQRHPNNGQQIHHYRKLKDHFREIVQFG